jgi:ribonucleoside-diphosphate reductase alpha chain
MYVIKRNKGREAISFDKILRRVKNICKENNININCPSLVMKVIDQLHDNIETTKIDELTAQQCTMLATTNPDYGKLASHITISNHHKNTSSDFVEVMGLLYNFRDVKNKNHPLITEDVWKCCCDNTETLNNIIDYNRDYEIDYFGFKTLEKSYLMRVNGKRVERPQHMWLRVAIGIHSNNLEAVKETYDLMSLKYFTHATPTLFNAGTPKPQLSSCFLLGMEDDSIDGIYNTLKETAQISKLAGGIGLHIHNIRASGSHINGTNGTSNGIVPMLKVFNNTARYVDQGGGRRNGSFAIYLEPWHLDIEGFLDLKKNHGDEEQRARDLFYGLWIPDLFMKRVETQGDWLLCCPNECSELSDLYGDKFVEKYTHYEKLHDEGKLFNSRKVSARELWFKILDSQMETGTPYMLYKDACNQKSNQKNIGTIKSSNLCTEIVEYSDDKESAVCNLASIALSKFVKSDKKFDYDKLISVTRVVTRNLNRIIDINHYPTPKTERSNVRHRPIGIGVQGLADAFILMDIPFHSEEAKIVNKKIFETIYYGAIVESCEQAKLHGSYESFPDSPASHGKLQFDMWSDSHVSHCGYDWTSVKNLIAEFGLRNSLLLAPMPTASTSQILGNNECFEPLTSNIYSRRTGAGEFVMANKYLIRELLDMNLWNDDIKNNIIENKGSIQHIDIIPKHIRDKYKIVWEMPMKHIIDMAADRGQYICQSQSLNLWMEDPTYKTLTAMHFYGWKKGLKTGIYYLRRKPKHQPQQFTIKPKGELSETDENKIISDENHEICEMCSS